jgi:hypothetical protein
VALAALLGVSGWLFGRRALFLTRIVLAGKPVDRRNDTAGR